MNNSALRALQNVVLDGVDSSNKPCFERKRVMKTKYFLLRNDKSVKINCQITNALLDTHNIKQVKAGGTNFVFVHKGDQGNFFPIINKVLKSKGICVCEKCGAHHAANFAYCPWCGRNNWEI